MPQALDLLACSGSDKLRRRALKLFADKVRLLRGELEALADLPAKEREAHEDKLAAAALLPCAMLAASQAAGPVSDAAVKPKKGSKPPTAGEEPLSALTRQALLATVGASAAAFGSARPGAVAAAVPAIVAAAADVEAPAAVRGSALVALAAVAQAVGTRLVPSLPAAMKALLASGQSSSARLSASAGLPSVMDVATPGKGTSAVAKEAAASGGKGKKAAEDADEEEAILSTEEAAAIELAAALAALAALVRSLGAFLSPYLREVLSLVLAPTVLASNSAGCSAAAAAVRAELPTAGPARLLLEPLFAQLPVAVGLGADSTLALIGTVALTTEKMESKVAAAYHEQVRAACIMMIHDFFMDLFSGTFIPETGEFVLIIKPCLMSP